MNNPNKHKPLSPEELFKMLDNTSNKASDFDELDDFEREALEGFSAHSDSKRAQALTEELDLAISKKIADSHKGSSKNKVIWFSAAASIVLIIMISVFFFNQSKDDSQTNIVLNEMKEGENSVASQGEPTPPLEIVSENTINNNVSGTGKEKIQTTLFESSEGPEKEAGESVAGMITESTMGYSENKSALSPALVVSKDEAKNRREDDYDALQKHTEVLADKVLAKEKSKIANLEQEKAPDDISVTLSEKNMVAANTKVVKEEAYKADIDKNERAKKSADKQNVSKEQSTVDAKNMGTVAYSQTTPASESTSAPAQGTGNNSDAAKTTPVNSVNNYSAYYTGGELEIKKYVLDYCKKSKSTLNIAGKYKITISVYKNGVVNVFSISTANGCTNCVELITKALESSKSWVPAIKDGKSVVSNLDFILIF